MGKSITKSSVITAISLCLSFAVGSAFAQVCDPKDPKCEPPPPPKGTADCSPGYYKNHPETWCGYCVTEASCDAVLEDLRARGPGSSAIRDAAKDILDSCFGTAEASPCMDDDY